MSSWNTWRTPGARSSAEAMAEQIPAGVKVMDGTDLIRLARSLVAAVREREDEGHITHAEAISYMGGVVHMTAVIVSSNTDLDPDLVMDQATQAILLGHHLHDEQPTAPAQPAPPAEPPTGLYL